MFKQLLLLTRYIINNMEHRKTKLGYVSTEVPTHIVYIWMKYWPLKCYHGWFKGIFGWKPAVFTTYATVSRVYHDVFIYKCFVKVQYNRKILNIKCLCFQLMHFLKQSLCICTMSLKRGLVNPRTI